MLFVDNPVGAGFSYVNTSTYPSNLDEIADDLLVFLTTFLELKPTFRVSGEAGKLNNVPLRLVVYLIACYTLATPL